MSEVIGWTLVAAWLLAPVIAVSLALHWIFSRRLVERKYEGIGGGLVGGLDAVYSPGAYEAGIERDRQTQRTAPALAPGDPPWTIGDGRRIRIDI
ncbi:MAG: hypothetical protein WA971_12300 [Microbacterium sp.]